MLIIIGHVIATPALRAGMLALAAEHCARSRGEPGCLAHGCHVDIGDPLRLVFIEQWADPGSLRAHFSKPESAAFAKAMRDMSAATPVMKIFHASEAPISDLG